MNPPLKFFAKTMIVILRNLSAMKYVADAGRGRKLRIINKLELWKIQKVKEKVPTEKKRCYFWLILI